VASLTPGPHWTATRSGAAVGSRVSSVPETGCGEPRLLDSRPRAICPPGPSGRGAVAGDREPALRLSRGRRCAAAAAAVLQHDGEGEADRVPVAEQRVQGEVHEEPAGVGGVRPAAGDAEQVGVPRRAGVGLRRAGPRVEQRVAHGRRPALAVEDGAAADGGVGHGVELLRADRVVGGPERRDHGPVALLPHGGGAVARAAAVGLLVGVQEEAAARAARRQPAAGPGRRTRSARHWSHRRCPARSTCTSSGRSV
jgi:hypothetical protein